MSPLALDVSIARVCLAAVKACRGLQVSADEKKAARMVTNFFQRMRKEAHLSVTVPSGFAADKETRDTIEKGLAALTLKPEPALLPEDTIDVLLEILAELARGKPLNADQSDQLLGHLHGFRDYTESDPVPDLVLDG